MLLPRFKVGQGRTVIKRWFTFLKMSRSEALLQDVVYRHTEDNWISGMIVYIFLYSDYYLHFCCCYYNVSTVVSPGLYYSLVDPVKIFKKIRTGPLFNLRSGGAGCKTICEMTRNVVIATKEFRIFRLRVNSVKII